MEASLAWLARCLGSHRVDLLALHWVRAFLHIWNFAPVFVIKIIKVIVLGRYIFHETLVLIAPQTLRRHLSVIIVLTHSVAFLLRLVLVSCQRCSVEEAHAILLSLVNFIRGLGRRLLIPVVVGVVCDNICKVACLHTWLAPNWL